jgi:hypothetical protein
MNKKNLPNLKLINIIVFIIFLTFLALTISFSYKFSNSDSIVIRGQENYPIVTFGHYQSSKHLYNNPEELNFNLNQYTPLYFYIGQALINIFSIDYYDQKSFYIFLRSLSSIFSFTTILLFSLLFYFKLQTQNIEKKQDLYLRIIFYSSFLHLYNINMPWFSLARMDAFIPIIILSYVYAVMFYEGEKKYFLLGLISSLGFCLKQNLLVLLIYSLFNCILTSKISLKKIIYLCFGALLGFTPLFFACFQDGYYLVYLNLYHALDNGSNSQAAFFTYERAIKIYFFPLILHVYLIYEFLISKKKAYCNNDSNLLYLATFLFLVGIFTAFKIGSAENYFIEWCLVIFVIFSKKLLQLKNLKFYSIFIICILMLVLSMSLTIHRLHNQVEAPIYINKLNNLKKFLENNLREGEYFINLADDGYNYGIKGYGIAETPWVIRWSYEKNKFNYTKLKIFLEENKVKFIISDKKTLSEIWIINNKIDKYKLIDEIDGRYIFGNEYKQ